MSGAASGKPYLLLVSGANRVNEKGVAAHLGEKLKRPDADAVRALTGYAIGGIPPFGHATPLATYMDRDLLQYDVIWAAAGTPKAVFRTEPAALRDARRGGDRGEVEPHPGSTLATRDVRALAASRGGSYSNPRFARLRIRSPTPKVHSGALSLVVTTLVSAPSLSAAIVTTSPG